MSTLAMNISRLLPALLMCPLVAWAGAPLVSIDLPATAVVSGARVRLGQIARVSSPDFDIVHRLVELPLGTLPMQANGAVLDRPMLSRWIRSQIGLRQDQVEWLGAPAVHIAAETALATPESIQGVAQEALRTWLNERTDRFQITPVTRISEQKLYGQSLRMTVRPIRDTQPLPRMQVLVDLISKQGVVKTIPVSFDVHAQAMRLVANRNAEIGGDPTEIVHPQTVDITALRALGQAISPSDLTDTRMRLRRPLRAGEVILASDIEPTPAVQRGTWITLRMNDGSIAMEGRAEALQDGAMGQNVRVRPLGAERSILARVAGNSMVEVLK